MNDSYFLDKTILLQAFDIDEEDPNHRMTKERRVYDRFIAIVVQNVVVHTAEKLQIVVFRPKEIFHNLLGLYNIHLWQVVFTNFIVVSKISPHVSNWTLLQFQDY